MPLKKGKSLSNDGKNNVGRAEAQSSYEKRPIDKLLGSGARIDVLWCLMKTPVPLLASEIQRETKRSLKDVQRALKLLRELHLVYDPTVLGGILHPEDMHLLDNPEWLDEQVKLYGVKRYILRKKHPWVPALRMLLEISLGSLYVLREEVPKFISIDVAFIYGSFATSEQTPESDIDIIFIGHQTIRSLATDISRIEKRINREIDFRTYTPDDWRKKYEEKNHFIRSLMSEQKIFLIGDPERLERITTG